MKDIAFIIGVEKNEGIQLEQMAILLARSIRKFGGIYKDAPIYSVQPTGNDIDPETLEEFKKLGVCHVKDIINPFYTGGFGFYNMPFACDYLTKKVKEEYVVWLDIDVLCLNEPVFPDIEDDEIICNTYDRNIMTPRNIDMVFPDLGRGSFLHKCLEKCYPRIDYPETGHYTWFQYKKTANPFWESWKNKFVTIMEDIRKEGIDIKDDRLHSAEEIAYTLALQNFDVFTREVPEKLGCALGITSPFTEHTQFFHYDGFKERDNFYKIFESEFFPQDKKDWVLENCEDLEILLNGKHFLLTL